MPECYYPRTIKLTNPFNKKTGELIHEINVPCGNCTQCIKRRRMEWGFRLEQELKKSKTAYFVTLTYNTENVPYDKWGNKILLRTTLECKKNYLETNNKKIPSDKYLRKMKMKNNKEWKDRSVEGFIKQLRTKHERNKETKWENYYNNLKPKDKIKYYIVGEYGSEEHTSRPHYHAIIYNAERKLIEQTWTNGQVHIVKANSETIGYTTKYLDKWKDKKQDWKKPKEFNLQSEGLGKYYIEKMGNWHKQNLEINYVTNSKNIKIPMPRYYRTKLLNELELQLQRSIIHNAIETTREEEIEKKGIIKYAADRNKKKHYIEHQFNKALKKQKL